MSLLKDLYYGTTDINFPKLWRPMLIVSGLLVAASTVSLAAQGLNLSIDFSGGAVWEVPAEKLTEDQAREILTGFDKADGSKIQEVTDAKGVRLLRVQASSAKDIAESQQITAKFAEKAEVATEQINVNTVGPSWGKEITKDAGIALLVFFLIISAYISWQLEWRMAVAALTAVAHDVIVTVGVYSLLRFEVTPATVISFLTILGYSLYDTIVVYDRVQHNSTRYDRSGKYTYTAMMRRSLNQVIMRSMNTTLVALLPVVGILAIGGVAFGQTVMFDFGLALFVGLLSGAYSSIAIASPVVVWLKEREEKYRRVRERARQRGAEDEANWIRPGAQLVKVGAPVVRDLSGDSAAKAVEAKAQQYERPHPPRPRKQGKKR